MSKKLFEKAGLIQLPPTPPSPSSADAEAPKESPSARAPMDDAARAASRAEVPSPALPPAQPRPKTAPGAMLHFLGTQSAAVHEAEELRERLSTFDGALPVRTIDPKRVRRSRWANRDEAHFAGAAFTELKDEIAAAGGNVQPIKVRPLAKPVDGAEFELAFGHRRHQACLELGLPVLAMIEPLTDQALFLQMERENRNRADLSAWEQGTMYARALDEGLFPSNRRLAASIGRDLGDVGRAIALARLPAPVIEAFATPLDLQFRWAKPLADAQQADPEGLLARAKELKDKAGLSAREVFEALVAPGAAKPAAAKKEAKPVVIKGVGGRVATLKFGEQGKATIELSKGTVPEDRRSKLAELLKEFLK